MSKSSPWFGRTIVSALLMLASFSSLSHAVTPDRISGPIDSTKSIALSKSLHPKAQPQYDRGLVDPSLRLTSMMLMTTPSPAQQKELKKFLADLQNRNSPNYHEWLTPSQYADRFGLSQNDVRRITAWLKGQGFVVQSVGGGRNTISFSGTAAEVQTAFKTEIRRYVVDGEEHFANSTALMIPTALRGVVTEVFGAHNFRMHPASRGRFGLGPRMRPSYHDTAYLFPNFLAPADVATIYDINTLYTSTPTAIDGTGQTIAVIGETDIFIEDINDFRSAFGLSTISGCTKNGTTGVITACNDPHFQYVLVLPAGGTDPGAPDSIQTQDITEADLDIEWSGAVAPGAQIIYINAPHKNGSGVIDSLTYAISPPSPTPVPAPVISLSYGLCEQLGTSMETLLEQAATEGITVINSSGDSGPAACDPVPPGGATPPFAPAPGGQGVSYPASSPYVVAAGGTSISFANDSIPSQSSYWLTTNGTNGESAVSYIPELPWNDNELFGQFCSSAANPSQIPRCSPASPAVPVTDAQTAQQDYWISAAGGGASNCFTQASGICKAGLPQPAWQTGLSVPNAPAGVRWVPDISFLSSPELPGYIFCTPQQPDATPTPTYTSTCVNGISGANGAVDGFASIVGGTSAAAPLFAGVMALMNQYLGTPAGQGDIHQTLYALAAQSNGAFNKVTTGDNVVFCEPGQPSGQPTGVICPSTGASAGMFGFQASDADANTGYNLVAGLGSINVSHFATAWLGMLTGFSMSTTVLSPASVSAGTSSSSTITVTPGSRFSGSVSLSCSGLPTGAACSFNPTTVSSANGWTATLTISTLSNVAAGTTTVTVNGTSTGAPSSSTTVSLVVTASQTSFTMGATALNPTSASAGTSTSSMITITPVNGFSGTVSFSCSGLPTGASCSFTPTTVSGSGTTTLTISTLPNMAKGTTTVTVNAASAGVPSVSTPLSLIVTATGQSFTLSSNLTNSTLAVTQGASGVVNITVGSTTGFVVTSAGNSATTLPVTYSCSGLPNESQCLVSPNSTTSATSVSVTITTTAPIARLAVPSSRSTRIFYAVMLPGLFGIMFTLGARKRSLRGARMLGLIMVLGTSTMWLGSCGGSNNSSSSNPGTPKGNSSVTINATTGGASPITASLPVTLSVQ
jgi:Pro-kumamolisin, activation domain